MLTRRALIAALLIAIMLGLLAPISSAGAAAAVGPLGVFRGSGRPDLVAEYEGWLGRSVGYTVDFVGRAPTSDPAPWSKIDDPSWWCNRWSSRSSTLSLSTAMLPNSNFSLAAGARGDYDTHWRSFGETLVAKGCADTILRLGWEFNGKFFPWAAGGKEADFAAYWRRIVTTLRAVPNQRFLFDWAPLAGNTNANVEAAYPGDAYVDIVGLDAYDTSTVSVSNREARWDDQVGRRYGLAWQRDFARSHGKAMSFPEWGVMVRPNDNLGGGDNPFYIERMWEWIAANSVLYASYFEVDASDGAHRLMTSQFPNASARYRDLVNQSDVAPTTTTTAPTTTTTAPTTTTTAPLSAAAIPSGAQTLWAPTTSPTSTSSDAASVEVGVKVRTATDGVILGVRFYKAATNVGTHVATLWHGDGSLLAQAPFTAETASGWQQVLFATPVVARAGTTYVASYHAPSGHYALGAKTFKKAVRSGDLVGLRSGFDGPNGVYSYAGRPTFPTHGAPNASSYGVDVVFNAL